MYYGNNGGTSQFSSISQSENWDEKKIQHFCKVSMRGFADEGSEVRCVDTYACIHLFMSHWSSEE